MLLRFGYLYKFAMFYFFFLFYFYFFQKAENNSFKKASWSKFYHIIFLSLLKIGSVGSVGQQINLVSPKADFHSAIVSSAADAIRWRMVFF